MLFSLDVGMVLNSARDELVRDCESSLCFETRVRALNSEVFRPPPCIIRLMSWSSLVMIHDPATTELETVSPKIFFIVLVKFSIFTILF